MTLPERWIATTLGELGELYCGQSVSAPEVNTDGRGILYVTGPEQWDGHSIHENKWTENPKRIVPEGCIFVTVKGAGVGKTFPGIACAIGRDVYAFRPDDGIDVDFVHRAIRNRIGSIVGEARGDIPGLSKDHLTAHAMGIPPLAEQRRIVAKLDTLTARLVRARAELDRVPVLAKHLREVALTAARTAMASAQHMPVSEIATITFDGPFGSNLKSADYVDEGVRVVRLENIGHLGFISDKETFISPEKYEGLKRHTLAPGDILFSSFVDREVRVCLFPDNLGHVAINKADCFAIRPDLALCDAQYVTYMLASAETYEAMKENVRGVTRPRIGLSQLRNYEIPLPPVQEQERVAAKIKATFARANRLEAEATRARALLDRLESALLAKAFRGELIPQDPNDEPAQTLLDRIRKDRTAAPKPKRGRRKKETT